MSHQPACSSDIMTVAAARRLRDGAVCFVGIGIPSTAANLARLTHAPNVCLVYESGTIGSKPDLLPLSIGDGNLAATADTVVSTPEVFSYWLQGGRIDVGFLGAAQVDRFANLNSTVIGEYASPKVRLPGAGGAPEIAAMAAETIVIINHDKQKLVQKLEFVTSAGYLDGGDAREKAGLNRGGPKAVITDLGILEPEPVTKELVVTHLHPGVTREQVRAATGWEIRFADDLEETAPPSETELRVLHDLVRRSEAARAANQAANSEHAGVDRRRQAVP